MYTENKEESETRREDAFLTVLAVWVVMPYLYSWVWSCSIEPGRWELSSIRWHSIPPACNPGCTRSGSQRQQQSCSPYDGHFWAQGLSCTGWHLSVAQLWRDGKKDKVSAGFLKNPCVSVRWQILYPLMPTHPKNKQAKSCDCFWISTATVISGALCCFTLWLL